MEFLDAKSSRNKGKFVSLVNSKIGNIKPIAKVLRRFGGCKKCSCLYTIKRRLTLGLILLTRYRDFLSHPLPLRAEISPVSNLSEILGKVSSYPRKIPALDQKIRGKLLAAVFGDELSKDAV